MSKTGGIKIGFAIWISLLAIVLGVRFSNGSELVTLSPLQWQADKDFDLSLKGLKGAEFSLNSQFEVTLRSSEGASYVYGPVTSSADGHIHVPSVRLPTGSYEVHLNGNRLPHLKVDAVTATLSCPSRRAAGAGVVCVITMSAPVTPGFFSSPDYDLQMSSDSLEIPLTEVAGPGPFTLRFENIMAGTFHVWISYSDGSFIQNGNHTVVSVGSFLACPETVLSPLKRMRCRLELYLGGPPVLASDWQGPVALRGTFSDVPSLEGPGPFTFEYVAPLSVGADTIFVRWNPAVGSMVATTGSSDGLIQLNVVEGEATPSPSVPIVRALSATLSCPLRRARGDNVGCTVSVSGPVTSGFFKDVEADMEYIGTPLSQQSGPGPFSLNFLNLVQSNVQTVRVFYSDGDLVSNGTAVITMLDAAFSCERSVVAPSQSIACTVTLSIGFPDVEQSDWLGPFAQAGTFSDISPFIGQGPFSFRYIAPPIRVLDQIRVSWSPSVGNDMPYASGDSSRSLDIQVVGDIQTPPPTPSPSPTPTASPVPIIATATCPSRRAVGAGVTCTVTVSAPVPQGFFGEPVYNLPPLNDDDYWLLPLRNGTGPFDVSFDNSGLVGNALVNFTYADGTLIRDGAWAITTLGASFSCERNSIFVGQSMACTIALFFGSGDVITSDLGALSSQSGKVSNMSSVFAGPGPFNFTYTALKAGVDQISVRWANSVGAFITNGADGSEFVAVAVEDVITSSPSSSPSPTLTLTATSTPTPTPSSEFVPSPTEAPSHATPTSTLTFEDVPSPTHTPEFVPPPSQTPDFVHPPSQTPDFVPPPTQTPEFVPPPTPTPREQISITVSRPANTRTVSPTPISPSSASPTPLNVSPFALVVSIQTDSDPTDFNMTMQQLYVQSVCDSIMLASFTVSCNRIEILSYRAGSLITEVAINPSNDPSETSPAQLYDAIAPTGGSLNALNVLTSQLPPTFPVLGLSFLQVPQDASQNQVGTTPTPVPSSSSGSSSVGIGVIIGAAVGGVIVIGVIVGVVLLVLRKRSKKRKDYGDPDPDLNSNTERSAKKSSASSRKKKNEPTGLGSIQLHLKFKGQSDSLDFGTDLDGVLIVADLESGHDDAKISLREMTGHDRTDIPNLQPGRKRVTLEVTGRVLGSVSVDVEPDGASVAWLELAQLPIQIRLFREEDGIPLAGLTAVMLHNDVKFVTGITSSEGEVLFLVPTPFPSAGSVTVKVFKENTAVGQLSFDELTPFSSIARTIPGVMADNSRDYQTDDPFDFGTLPPPPPQAQATDDVALNLFKATEMHHGESASIDPISFVETDADGPFGNSPQSSFSTPIVVNNNASNARRGSLLSLSSITESSVPIPLFADPAPPLSSRRVKKKISPSDSPRNNNSTALRSSSTKVSPSESPRKSKVALSYDDVNEIQPVTSHGSLPNVPRMEYGAMAAPPPPMRPAPAELPPLARKPVPRLAPLQNDNKSKIDSLHLAGGSSIALESVDSPPGEPRKKKERSRTRKRSSKNHGGGTGAEEAPNNDAPGDKGRRDDEFPEF